MPMIEFSESDLLRNKIVTPGWYRVHIDSVAEWAPSKDGNSLNCAIAGVILCNADDGSEEFKGVPLEWLFNNNPKVRGFIEGFLRAFGVDVTASRYDIGAAQGKDLDVFVQTGEYNGRKKNEINHQYRAPRAA